MQKGYEECVSTVRGTMLVLLSFCLFSIVSTLGTPDSALIASDAKIKLPFADADIAFPGFLVGAPFLLILLTVYLHIFNTRRLELEKSFDISPVPALFTLNRPLPNALTNLIFFWLVPIVLGVITWKALARLWWGLPLLVVTILVTAALLSIQIRRRSADRRFLKNLPLWIVLIGIACVAFFSAWDPNSIRRPLNLFRVDLGERWLAGADLRNADLRSASLVKADLSGAYLGGAKLSKADLRDATLTVADLQGADLGAAKLQGADLMGATLRNANLGEANLQGADLRRAKLQGADLGWAQLQGADLRWAEFKFASLDRAELQGADLGEANLQGADLRTANFQGANLREVNLLGADLREAELQGADLRGAHLQGADLREAKLQGTDLTGANIWLASFPHGLRDQSPAALGVVEVAPLTAAARAKLKKEIQGSVTDGQLMDDLDPILRDDPPKWADAASWTRYLSEAKEPSPDELAQYLTGLACRGAGRDGTPKMSPRIDTSRWIVRGLARRAEAYSQDDSKRHYAKQLAQALLNANCDGAEAMNNEIRVILEGLASTPE